MKICIVTSSFPSNGTDSIEAPFLIDVIYQLTAQGHSVTVYTHWRPQTIHDSNPAQVHYFDGGRFSGSVAELAIRPLLHLDQIARYVIKGALGLRRLHHREAFDVLICCWTVPSGLLARFASLMGPMPPYAVWALGSDINILKRQWAGRVVLRWILRGAAACFADGLVLAEDVRRISRRACEFLPTFRSLGPLTDTPKKQTGLFLFVGRHERVKGIDLLIEAFIRLHKRRPDLHFAADIVGDGSLSKHLQNRIKDEGMAPQIRFRGKLPKEALVRSYAQSDCVVIPSRSESLPLVLGEAIQARRSVIVTDVGDMGYLVRTYELGSVTEGIDAESLTMAIESYLSGQRHAARARWQEALDFIAIERNFPVLLQRLNQLKELPCAS